MREQLSTRLEHELDSRSVGLAAWLYRRTRGRIARLYHRDVLLLTTTGRRSGLRRTVPLQFFADGDDMVVVAANSGMATHPAWYLNLKSEPEALVELGGESVPVHAEEMSEAETESFWKVVLRRAPDYSRYPERTDRRIPMVRLTPDASPRPAESHSTATPLVRTTVGALGFVGMTALAGGIEMIAACGHPDVRNHTRLPARTGVGEGAGCPG